ncbi:MAG: hypothetical protein CR975_05625 [Gammaproteobacteria bacterium]|nr:MAG: hypothetical protein CR975_05625 [Gammaproteobacteria bacterium]
MTNLAKDYGHDKNSCQCNSAALLQSIAIIMAHLAKTIDCQQQADSKCTKKEMADYPCQPAMWGFFQHPVTAGRNPSQTQPAEHDLKMSAKPSYDFLAPRDKTSHCDKGAANSHKHTSHGQSDTWDFLSPRRCPACNQGLHDGGCDTKSQSTACPYAGVLRATAKVSLRANGLDPQAQMRGNAP